MKDYYRILGIKESASDEEVRLRWIELMKQHHPDVRNGEAPDERVKEINEAYDTLKYPSTRAKYDLKRAYERRKRRSYLRKQILRVSIVAVPILLISILYYHKRPQVSEAPPPPGPSISRETDRVNEIKEQKQMIEKKEALPVEKTPSNDEKVIRSQRSALISPPPEDQTDHVRSPLSTPSYPPIIEKPVPQEVEKVVVKETKEPVPAPSQLQPLPSPPDSQRSALSSQPPKDSSPSAPRSPLPKDQTDHVRSPLSTPSYPPIIEKPVPQGVEKVVVKETKEPVSAPSQPQPLPSPPDSQLSAPSSPALRLSKRRRLGSSFRGT